MAKAKRDIRKDASRVDLIVEILDARAPLSSMNPDMKDISSGKQTLLLLNKSDLADPVVTRKWQDYFLKHGTVSLAMDARNKENISRVVKKIKRFGDEKHKKDLTRGIISKRSLKVLIYGIPNVGKSTFVNTLSGKASLKTGDKPGITKGNQYINVNNEFLLLDTPGMLWPKFEDEHTARWLALLDSINDDILNKEELALVFLDFLYINYRELLFERYDILEKDPEGMVQTEDQYESGRDFMAHTLLNLISQKRGCFKRGGSYDYAKSSAIVIDDFRSGRLGRISLETP